MPTPHPNQRLTQNSLTAEEREQLARDHIGLVRWWANKMHWRSSACEWEDCLSLGFLGLARAVMYWQPSYGFTFTTYATYWIRQSIGRGRSVLLRHGFKGVRDARPNRPLSIQHEDREGGRDAQDLICDRPSADHSKTDLWHRLMRCLSPNLREVVEMRYVEDMTLEEVGEVLDVTRERVRQLEEKALFAIRRRCRDSIEAATGLVLPFRMNGVNKTS